MRGLVSRLLLTASILLMSLHAGFAATDEQMLPPTNTVTGNPCATGANQVLIFSGTGTGGISAINCLNGGFTVDPASNDVGIGTNSPGAIDSPLTTLPTTTGSSMLDVRGNLAVGTGTSNASIFLNDVPTARWQISSENYQLTFANDYNGGTGGVFTPLLTILNTGNVGIGTVSPQAALDVNGGTRVGNDTDACSAANAGTIRWTGSAFQGCDGTNWNSLGGTIQSTVFTAGSSGTFVIPSSNLKATLIGGGGGGATGGGGGGSGAGGIVYLSGLTVGNTIAYSVGTAGAAGGLGSRGGNGGDTTITVGSTVYDADGGPGAYSDASPNGGCCASLSGPFSLAMSGQPGLDLGGGILGLLGTYGNGGGGGWDWLGKGQYAIAGNPGNNGVILFEWIQ